MKKNNLTLSLFFILMLLITSCKATYYQVYNVQPKSNSLVYEDENCKVEYNFWSNGGNVEFSMYNKTDDILYVDMEKSFFILNGIAFDYFQNREFSKLTNTITSKTNNSMSIYGHSIGFGGTTTQTDYAQVSLTTKECEIVAIPPKASKRFLEYKISTEQYRDCELFLYPKNNRNNKITFTEKSSPLVFKNRLTYFLEPNNLDYPITFENEFYVSEITNYHEKELKTEEYEKNCPDETKSNIKYIIFNNYSPYKFYVEYYYPNIQNRKH